MNLLFTKKTSEKLLFDVTQLLRIITCFRVHCLRYVDDYYERIVFSCLYKYFVSFYALLFLYQVFKCT